MKKLLELEIKLRKAKSELNKQEVNAAPGGSAPSIASQIGWPGTKKSEKEEEKKDDKKDKEEMAEALDQHNEKKHGEAKDKDSAFKDLKVKKGEDYFKTEMCKFDNNGQWSLHKANEMATSRQKNLDPAITFQSSSLKADKDDSNGVQMMAPELKKAEKKLDPFAAKKQMEADRIVSGKPQPAKVTNVKTGETKIVTPEENAKAKASAKNANKIKFEAEAAARRAQFKKK